MLRFTIKLCLITNFTLGDQSNPKLDLMYSCKFANTHSIRNFLKENNQKGVLILDFYDQRQHKIAWLKVQQTLEKIIQENWKGKWNILRQIFRPIKGSRGWQDNLVFLWSEILELQIYINLMFSLETLNSCSLTEV